MEKTIKVSEWVHAELKTFIAKSKDNMTTFTDAAILQKLGESGHKINRPKDFKTKKQNQ